VRHIYGYPGVYGYPGDGINGVSGALSRAQQAAKKEKNDMTHPTRSRRPTRGTPHSLRTAPVVIELKADPNIAPFSADVGNSRFPDGLAVRVTR
jgi:hypothetical protein